MFYIYNEYTKFFIEHNNCFVIKYDMNFFDKILPCKTTEDCFFSYKNKKLYLEPFTINNLKCFRIFYNGIKNCYSLNGWDCPLHEIVQNYDMHILMMKENYLFAFPNISKQNMAKIKLLI